jgi:hypothetical protein
MNDTRFVIYSDQPTQMKIVEHYVLHCTFTVLTIPDQEVAAFELCKSSESLKLFPLPPLACTVSSWVLSSLLSHHQQNLRHR